MLIGKLLSHVSLNTLVWSASYFGHFLGNFICGFLTRAGHDVTLIDPWAEQVETVRQKGISVTGPHDPFEARPAIHHLHEAQRLPRDFEVAFVAMKVYDTAWAAQLAVRHLKSDGFVVAG